MHSLAVRVEVLQVSTAQGQLNRQRLVKRFWGRRREVLFARSGHG